MLLMRARSIVIHIYMCVCVAFFRKITRNYAYMRYAIYVHIKQTQNGFGQNL